MSNGKTTRKRVWVLVKAYPQPSQQYGETVCVAGILEDQSSFVRLYPIRYRMLPEYRQFDRFDLIEVEVFRPNNDQRPESFRAVEDSIRILREGKKASPESRVELWRNFVSPSLTALQEDQKANGTSLGIVRPDPESVRLKVKPFTKASDEDKAATRSMKDQQALFEERVTPVPDPEYVFSYAFTSGGHQHEMQIHDWEVQATWFHYKRQYGEEDGMRRLREMYEQVFPANNLHLLMGTLNSRRWQFMIIGLLRSTVDMDAASSQGSLF